MQEPMKDSRRGTKRCPTCGCIMYEHVGMDSLDYWKCSNCVTMIRIFHNPIRIEKPFDGLGHA